MCAHTLPGALQKLPWNEMPALVGNFSWGPEREMPALTSLACKQELLFSILKACCKRGLHTCNWIVGRNACTQAFGPLEGPTKPTESGRTKNACNGVPRRGQA